MADVLTYVGSESISATIPGVFAAVSVGQADLQARIDALLTFSPGAVSFAAQLQLAQQMVADISAAISLGVVPPSISAQVALVLGILAGLQSQLAIILAFYNVCAAAGIDLYAYDGTTAGLGAQLASATAGGLPSGGGPAAHCNAVVLATSIGATWAAMAQVFKVS